MELNDYQKKAMTTCMESSNNFSYMMLNLVGEVGELSSKVAKAIRKEQVEIGYMAKSDIFFKGDKYEDAELEVNLRKEAGDVLWQLAGLCSVMGWKLEDIAEMNLDKLQQRKKNGTIDGSGDGVTKEERK